MSNGSPDPASSRVRLSGRALTVAAGVFVVLTVGVGGADGWYRAHLLKEARSRTSAIAEGRASALRLALAQRSVLVSSLAAWLRESAPVTHDSFKAFAQSLYGVAPGIRALQWVVRGHIQDTYPLKGNEAALGLDLLNHPDSAVSRGLLRALDRGTVTLTGPLRLVQGSIGVILRRSAGAPGDREARSAAVVVDLPVLLDEAGISARATGLDIFLSGPAGEPIAGHPLAPAADPVLVRVDVPDGPWTLAATPPGGWAEVLTAPLRRERVLLMALVLLGTLLSYGLVDRDTRLGRAVAVRTAELTRANRRLDTTAAELALRDEHLQAALDAGRVVTWALDVRTGEIHRFSGERSFYLGGVSVPGSVDELLLRVHPEDRESFVQGLEEARSTGKLSQEFRVDLGDGREAWMRTEGRANEWEDGRPTRIIGAVIDISRMKELEREVLHRGRLEVIGQLAGGLVHDLNNALTVVRGELELSLQDEEAFPLREAAQEALEATTYGAVLLGQVLTFARKDHVVPTTFRWDDMCSEAATFLGRLLGRNVELSLHLDAEGASVTMDRSQAVQILANLATNARDAMEGVGRLTIATRVEDADSSPGVTGRQLVTRVSDAGPGIPPEIQERIFDAFFTTKGSSRGTGLGLSTTQRIVGNAGGDIRVESSPAGTTFVITFPVAEG